MTESAPHITHRLSEYLDNALPVQEKRAVEKHLDECKDCSHQFKELQHNRERLKNLPKLTPPESFYRGVLQQIEENRKPILLWDWPAATKAIATFGVLAVVVMVAREARRSEPALFTAPVPAPAPLPPTPAPVSEAASSPAKQPEPAPVAAPRQDETRRELDKKGALKNEAPANGKQKLARKSMAALNYTVQPEEKERKKDMDRLPGDVAQPLAVGGLANKATNVERVSARSRISDIALQARDTRGAATQGSFMESAKSPVPAKAATSPGEEWKGDSSGITAFREVIVTNDVDWNKLWAEHVQNQVPPPLAPAVDFNRFTVVGVFAGSKPSGGYTVTITEIKNGLDAIGVSYREQGPPAGTAAAAVITQPYDIRLIPKTSLPVTFIKLP